VRRSARGQPIKGDFVASRRQFLRSSLACSALTSLPAFALAEPARAVSPANTLERFVVDVRFAAARAVARPCACSGVRQSEVRGDLTPLWYDDLDLRWRMRPMTLAGATTPDALFVLETLAMDRGMRVVYRGRHEPARGGRVAHTLEGPPDLLARMTRGDAAPWGVIGEALERWPAEAAKIAMTFKTHTAARLEQPLVTWVIAPRRPAAARPTSI
jgi:hypothetical protein